MADLTYVTYCGLYCKLCSSLGRIPQQARALRDTMRAEGCEFWGPSMEGFGSFWAFLDDLVRSSDECPGCRGGCGDPGCAIRGCAQERDVELCPLCADYPCEHIDRLAVRYPTLLADGAKMREVSIEAWLVAQEQRVARGACYADLRY